MLPKDRATIVFGEGGSGKSYIAALLGLSLASGKQVFPGWEPVKPGKVLVLDWEADREEWNERLLLLAAGAGLAVEDFAPRMRYRSCITSLVDQVEELAKYVKDEGIDLVIVDSVGMASPGAREGTDANEGALQLFRGLRLLRCTALLVDHVSKQGKESANGAKDPYGSIFKTNLARQTWEVRREDPEGEEQATAELVLVNRKVNNGPRRNPIGCRITYAENEVRFVRSDLEDVAESLQGSIPAAVQIKGVLLRTPRMTKTELAEGLPSLTKSNLDKTLDRLVRRGEVGKDSTGRYTVVFHAKEDSGDF
jgi:RecA-family ATPase